MAALVDTTIVSVAHRVDPSLPKRGHLMFPHLRWIHFWLVCPGVVFVPLSLYVLSKVPYLQAVCLSTFSWLDMRDCVVLGVRVRIFRVTPESSLGDDSHGINE